MRILLFGDGRWATDSIARLARDGFEVAGVVARAKPSGPGFLEAGARMGLPVLQPERVNSSESIRWVAQLKPDISLSIAYDQILGRTLLDIPEKGFVNFHAGKLPNYRGRNVINWAIINGETEIGLTSHYIDQGIDTGDIILQRCLPIGWTDTYGDVLDKVVAAFPDLVAETVSLVSTGQAQAKPQAHSTSTYFGGRGPGDEWLDWSDTSYNLHNKIRAITRPGPGATTVLEDQEVIIWRAFYDINWPNHIATPGQIVGRKAGEGVVVKTGDSTILVQEVQLEEGNPQAPAWSIGTRLGINLQSHLLSLQAKVDKLEHTVQGLTGEKRDRPDQVHPKAQV